MHSTQKWILLLATLAAMPAARADAPASPAGAAKYLGGLDLVDQNDKAVDLYRDVIADHTVVIHSFFTGCTESCPVTMNTLKAVQGRLGDRMDREVRLVSISVDPAHDTPAALKAYAQRVQAKPGWLFLTGSSEQVGNALKRIGQYVDEPTAHMDLIVAGNMRTGLWKKILGTAPLVQTSELILGVVDDKGAAGDGISQK
jgi:protein SCO1/2